MSKEHQNLAFQLVTAERKRQVSKGYDDIHDDTQPSNNLAHKSAYYLILENPLQQTTANKIYPYGEKKPPRRNQLDHAIRGAALAVAEVERLLRLGMVQTEDEPEVEPDPENRTETDQKKANWDADHIADKATTEDGTQETATVAAS